MGRRSLRCSIHPLGSEREMGADQLDDALLVDDGGSESVHRNRDRLGDADGVG